MEKFPIRIRPFLKPLFLVITATQERAWIEVTEDAVTVRFGWWQDKIGLSEIEGVESMHWPWLYGYGMRLAPKRTLGLVGASEGVVVMTLKHNREFRVPIKLRMRRVVASLQDPQGFIDMLQLALDARNKSGGEVG